MYYIRIAPKATIKKYRDISCEVDVRKVNLNGKFKTESFLRVFSCVVNNERDLMRSQYHFID
jgi:hypothetical protein